MSAHEKRGHSSFSSKKRNAPFSQEGFVLMPVVLALVVVAAVALLLNHEGATDVALVRGQAEHDTLRYVTEAGLAHAKWQLSQNTACSGYTSLPTTSFGSHSYSATIAPTDDSPVTIAATGALANGATQALTLESLRVYDVAAPVTLTLQPGAEGKDTFIEGDSGHTDHNKGGDSNLYTDSEATKQFRALLQFDLSVIPSTAHIQTATLELEVQTDSGSADTVEVHRLTRDWTEDGVTWNSYDGMQSWNTPGGDYDSQMAGSFLVDSTGWKSVDIAALAQGWVDGSLPNYGVILLSTPASGNNEKKYHSSDQGDATRRPKLTLTLSCECGQSCAMGGSTPTLWLSTQSDVTSSGAPGLDAWTDGEALVLTDPNFALEPTSNGTLFSAFNLDDFAGDADIDAIHYVDSDLTVGSTSSVDLKAGDVLLSTADNETLTSINSLSVNDEDVFVFRPATPGDYSSGTFIFLIDGSQAHSESDTVGISLVEKDTVVGNGNLLQGYFIMAITNRRDVIGFRTEDVGLGTTVGSSTELIDGPTLSFGSEIRGMDLAEDELTIGGHTIPAGAILLTLNNDDTGGVGDNLVPADSADMFYLTVTQVGPSPIADATLLFEGLDVNLDTSEEHLQAFTLTHSMSAGGGGGAPGKLLFVVGNASNLTTEETAHQTLIESWGYTVEIIDDDATQAEFDTAAANNDVAFATNDITASRLSTKLVDATIGVVTSEDNLSDEFGMASSIGWESGTVVEVNDNTHYITSAFSLGLLTVLSSSESLAYVTGTLSPDLGQLASSSSGYGVVTLDAGAFMFGGGPAAGRRVQLPWGGSGFNPNNLNADGLTILQRALEWGAGANSAGGAGNLLFVVSNAASPTAQEASRQTLIESWGYVVTLLDDGATQGEYDAAVALNDVVYISQEIATQTVGDKLRDAAIGIVNEEYLIGDELGLAAGSGSGFYNDMNLVDNTHYITSGFSLGALAVFSPSYDIYTGAGFTLAPGLQVLGEAGSMSVLVALDTGGALYDSGTAAGRRVQVPWGDDFSALNTDGQTIMLRAIEWAAAAGSGGGGGGGGGIQYVEAFNKWFAGQADQWEAVDLGALGVPADAVVEVAIVNEATNNERWGGIRAVGSSLDRRVRLHEAESGGDDVVVMHVQADGSAAIEHYSDETSDVYFAVMGYWTGGSFVERFDQFTAGGSNSWRDRDLAPYGVGSNQVAEIVMANTSTSSERQAGVRSGGSSLDRRLDIHEAESGGVDVATLLVAADGGANATIQVYTESNNDVDFYLTGYWSEAPGTFTESAGSPYDPSSPSNAWSDWDLASRGVPANAVVHAAMVNNDTGQQSRLGVREKGSANSIRYFRLQEAESGGSDIAVWHVNLDPSATAQWWDEVPADTHPFQVMGWWVLTP